jgi:hypothetical protein
MISSLNVSNKPRVNLVVACWGGPRRTPDSRYEADRAYYLKHQVDSLNRFDHNLTQITFVSTGGDTQEYYDYLWQVIAKKYTLIERENVGMSYGSFDAAWQADRSFDYYIFLEDDFVFVRDNFDSDMAAFFEALPDCGYLCQLAWGRTSPHPAIFNGIANRDCLSRLGVLPGSIAVGSTGISYYGAVETEGQRGWGLQVEQIGLKVYDMGRKFRAPFIEADGSMICWHPEAPHYVIAPVQMYKSILDNPEYIETYLMTDEDWRTFRAYYLFLRNVYLSDEDRARFTANVAPCRLKSREDLARAVSIYDGVMKNREELLKEEFVNLNQYAQQHGGEL